jgi:hypothetical protein
MTRRIELSRRPRNYRRPVLYDRDGVVVIVDPPAPDITPPVISDVVVTPGTTTATIVGSIDEAGTVRVRVGPSNGVYSTFTSSYVAATPGIGFGFSIPVTGLSEGTTYHYVVDAIDAATNASTTANATFATGTSVPEGENTLTAMSLLGVNASLVLAPTYTDPTGPVTLNLAPKYHTIGIELRFTGDDNADATCALEFKKSADGDYRAGLPLWRGAITTQRSFAGSILECDPGTSYDIRLTITDPSAGAAVVTATVSTWADNISTHAALKATATHYVNSQTGLDTRTEAQAQSSLTPWRTIDKAQLSAPSGAVVLVAAGYYAPSIRTRLLPITFVAENAACADQIADASTVATQHAGSRSVIHGQVLVAPTGQPATDPHGVYTAANVGGWVSTEVVGSGDGQPYTLWKKTVGSLANINVAIYGATRSGDFKRQHCWITDNAGTLGVIPNLSNPEGWAQIVSTNANFRSGVYQKPATSGELYIKWTDSGTPNDYWWEFTGSSRAGIRLCGANSRLSGMEVRAGYWSLLVGDSTLSNNPQNVTNVIVDHNLFSHGHFILSIYGVNATTATGGLYGQYPDGVTIQHNHFVDSMTRASEADSYVPSGDGWAPWWGALKDYLRLANGSKYISAKVTTSENVAVYTPNGCRRVVVRYNEFNGVFNGVSMAVGGANGSGVDRYAGSHIDIYKNYFHDIGDDCVEPENAKQCWQTWGNYAKDVAVFISNAPIWWGPHYIWRNRVFQNGVHGSALHYDPVVEAAGFGTPGQTNYFPPRLPGGSPNILKNKGTGTVNCRPILYFIHNTFWSNRTGEGTNAQGWKKPRGLDFGQVSAPVKNPMLVLRNNILRTTEYSSVVGSADWEINNDEDHNALVSANSGSGTGVQIESVKSYNAETATGSASISEYRATLSSAAGRPAAFGNGASTNTFGASSADVAFVGATAAATLDALLTDPENGDLTLKAGTNPLVGAGALVANINDVSGDRDLGYQER